MILQLHKIYEDGSTEFCSQTEIVPFEPPIVSGSSGADLYHLVSGMPDRLMHYDFRDWQYATHMKFVDEDFGKTWQWLVCCEGAKEFMCAAPGGKAQILEGMEA